MTQQILPFKYEEEKKEKNLTALSGLLLYLGLFKAMKLDKLINKHLEVKKDKQGYRDDQIILLLILLNLAGGRFPSSDFGENAAWWSIMILSLNIQTIMKQLVLGKGWKNKRMKSIRFHIINIPGRIVKDRGGKNFIVRITRGHPSIDLLNLAREKIMELGCLPAG